MEAAARPREAALAAARAATPSIPSSSSLAAAAARASATMSLSGGADVSFAYSPGCCQFTTAIYKHKLAFKGRQGITTLCTAE